MALLTDDPRRTENCKWDLKLIKAFYINEAFEIDGHPIHIEESSSITWSAKRKVLRSAKVVDQEQARMSEGKGKNHGVRIIAVPSLVDGHKWPTRASWAAEKEAKAINNDPGTEKLRSLAIAQEERARLKMMELNPSEA